MYNFSKMSPKKSRLEEDKSDLFHVYDRFAILQMLTLDNHVYHGIPVFKVCSMFLYGIYVSIQNSCKVTQNKSLDMETF